METNRHWTDDDLVDALYGVRRPDSHLDTCPECGARRSALARRRAYYLADMETAAQEIPADLLVAQRRAIYARLETRQWFPKQLRFAFAAAMVAGVCLFLYPSNPPPAPPAVSDSQLVSEVSSMLESPLPQPLAPMRGLFEEDPL